MTPGQLAIIHELEAGNAGAFSPAVTADAVRAVMLQISQLQALVQRKDGYIENLERRIQLAKQALGVSQS